MNETGTPISLEEAQHLSPTKVRHSTSQVGSKQPVWTRTVNGPPAPTRRPTGVKVLVRPNQCGAGRANIIVYNWDLKGAVGADMKRTLKVGAKYKVMGIRDYCGKPIRLPMAGMETGPEFNVFVLFRNPLARG